MIIKVNGKDYPMIIDREEFFKQLKSKYFLTITKGFIILVNFCNQNDYKKAIIYFIHHNGRYCIVNDTKIYYPGEVKPREHVNNQHQQFLTGNALWILRFYLLHGKLPKNDHIVDYDESAEIAECGDNVKKEFSMEKMDSTKPYEMAICWGYSIIREDLMSKFNATPQMVLTEMEMNRIKYDAKMEIDRIEKGRRVVREVKLSAKGIFSYEH